MRVLSNLHYDQGPQVLTGINWGVYNDPLILAKVNTTNAETILQFLNTYEACFGK